MAASNSGVFLVGVIISIIVGVLVMGIAEGQLRSLADTTANQEAEFNDFVDEVNSVCDNEQGVVRGSVQIDNYRINRSENDQSMLMLVNTEEEVQTSSNVNCPVLEEFSIDVDYRIEREDSRQAVKIYEDSTSSQIGGLSE
jgi:hypothetical protein